MRINPAQPSSSTSLNPLLLVKNRTEGEDPLFRDEFSFRGETYGSQADLKIAIKEAAGQPGFFRGSTTYSRRETQLRPLTRGERIEHSVNTGALAGSYLAMAGAVVGTVVDSLLAGSLQMGASAALLGGAGVAFGGYLVLDEYRTTKAQVFVPEHPPTQEFGGSVYDAGFAECFRR